MNENKPEILPIEGAKVNCDEIHFMYKHNNSYQERYMDCEYRSTYPFFYSTKENKLVVSKEGGVMHKFLCRFADEETASKLKALGLPVGGEVPICWNDFEDWLIKLQRDEGIYAGRMFLICDLPDAPNVCLVEFWNEFSNEQKARYSSNVVDEFKKVFPGSRNMAFYYYNGKEFVDVYSDSSTASNTIDKQRELEKEQDRQKHLMKPDDKWEGTSEFRSSRDSKNQELYNHTGSGTEAEYRSIKYQEKKENENSMITEEGIHGIVVDVVKRTLNEGVSGVCYQFRSLRSLASIILKNKLKLSRIETSPKGKDGRFLYSMSVTRQKTDASGYAIMYRTDELSGAYCRIQFDGYRLNERFKGISIDEFGAYGFPGKAKLDDFKDDNSETAFSMQAEDRVLSDKPEIENALKYIQRVDVMLLDKNIYTDDMMAQNDSYKNTLRLLVNICRYVSTKSSEWSDLIHIYLDRQSFNIQDGKFYKPNDILEKVNAVQ